MIIDINQSSKLWKEKIVIGVENTTREKEDPPVYYIDTGKYVFEDKHVKFKHD